MFPTSLPPEFSLFFCCFFHFLDICANTKPVPSTWRWLHDGNSICFLLLFPRSLVSTLCVRCAMCLTAFMRAVRKHASATRRSLFRGPENTKNYTKGWVLYFRQTPRKTKNQQNADPTKESFLCSQSLIRLRSDALKLCRNNKIHFFSSWLKSSLLNTAALTLVRHFHGPLLAIDSLFNH